MYPKYNIIEEIDHINILYNKISRFNLFWQTLTPHTFFNNDLSYHDEYHYERDVIGICLFIFNKGKRGCENK